MAPPRRITERDVSPPDPLRSRITKEKISNKRKGGPSNLTNRWWLEPEDTVFQHVSEVMTKVENRQYTRRIQNQLYHDLYSNFDFTVPRFGTRQAYVNPLVPRVRFTLNVVESCVDAATNKISKARPVPRIVTSKGRFKQQRKAQLLTKYLKGMISQLDLYEKAQDVFTDSCVWGTGALKLFVEDGEIKAKRVLIDDIVVDDDDARDGEPRALFQRSYVNRDVLMELFPDHADKIKEASGTVPGDRASPNDNNVVGVIESWHLPSSKESKDGRRVLCVSNCTLVSEEWNHDWFPFAFMRWKTKRAGFYGTGISEQLRDVQLAINKLCILIQESIMRMAKPTIFVPTTAEIVATHIADRIGAVVKYNPAGGQPTQINFTAQSPEVYNWLENLYRKAYEITGISQLSAQSQKPAGLNSGRALEEFQDIETSRFELTGQRYESFFCDVAKIVLTLSKELYADNKKLSVKVKGKKFLEEIDWKDAELDDDEFDMDIFPVSSLPDSPAGRLEAIQQYAQAGYIDKAMTMELLNLPDLDDYVSQQVAGLEHAKMVVDKARWEGEGTIVVPQMNCDAIKQLAHCAWLDAQTMDTPTEHLDLLINLMSQCDHWLNVAAGNDGSQQQPPQGGQAMPARPEAPPTNELMPMNGAAA